MSTTQVVRPAGGHQLDARRDLSAAEQGIYADLRVTLDEIHLLQQEHSALPTPTARPAGECRDGKAPADRHHPASLT